MDKNITGSLMKVKEWDTESRSILTMMSMMDNGKTTTDQVKQYGQMLKQE
jgi:hypothetical protein